MNLTFIHKNNRAHLILIMAGWGIEPGLFKNLETPGYDLAVGWDYTDESLDADQLIPYKEIILISWSMGVFESERILPPHNLPITLAIAINGTRTPVSDTEGIPASVFNGTLNGLSETTLIKFRRRMCGSAAAYSDFLDTEPQRQLSNLTDELQAIANRAATASQPAIKWDLAIIGMRDMIFPPANQQTHWHGTTQQITDDPHLPTFRDIISRHIINKEKVAERFGTTRTQYDCMATMQQNVAANLMSMLKKSIGQRSLDHVIEIGGGSGALTRSMVQNISANVIEVWDIAPMNPSQLPPGVTTVIDDAETRLRITPTASADLVISSSTLQWFNNPPAAIDQMARILRPGGTIAIAVYIHGTYSEIAQNLNSSLYYRDAHDYISRFPQERFNILTSTEETTTTFPDTRSLLEHIRETGVNAITATDTSLLRKALRDNSLRSLQYNTLYIIATLK